MKTLPEAPKRHSKTGRITFYICAALAFGFGIKQYSIYELDKAEQHRAYLDLKNLQKAIELYHRKYGHYPETKQGFRALVDKNVLGSIPIDPWGTPYDYRLDNDIPTVTSYGADKVPGGNGIDADLSLAAHQAE